MKAFTFATTLVLMKIKRDDKTTKTCYLNSKAETIINESDIFYILESTYTTIISNIPKFLGKGSGMIIDSVMPHKKNISEYKLLAASSYINFSKILNHPQKGLINIQNNDNSEYFKWFSKIIAIVGKIREIHKIEKKKKKEFYSHYWLWL